MIIDCDRCELRNVACGDCVVSVLLSASAGEVAAAGEVEVDATERYALAALADRGLVPPLRFVRTQAVAG